ncbi:MAG: P-loop NTPase fold protein, partial [Bacteroidia bacterium]
GSIISVGGSIWLLFKSVSGSLLPASDESAQNFQKNINDPIDTLKLHFQSMIKFPKKEIAIFIDDIDRCSSKNVVKLLEGIQTIFKSSKVLYVFAGDANWVRRCFEIEYQNFVTDFKKPGHSLGNFFVEKMFQMSIKIPVIAPQTLKLFLKKTLNPIDETITSNVSSASILADLKNSRNELEIESTLKQYRGTDNEQIAIKAAIEFISSSETLKNLEHELEAYYVLLPSNVRSVKRFINNYAIARQVLLLQGVSFTDVPMEVLVRWLVLGSQFPLLAEDISNDPTILDTKRLHPEILASKEYYNLANGYLTMDKVKLIIGK